MQAPAKTTPLLTWIVLAAAILLTACVAWRRAERVEYVSAFGSAELTKLPSGDTIEHRFIVPGHTNESFQWILETEAMFREGRWRLQTTPQDNAPFGRPVRAISPYRWWLAGVAWVRHLGSGMDTARAVEAASLWADPVLLGLWILIGAAVTWRCFGSLAATVFAAGSAGVFPFASGFLPAAPDHHGLAWILGAASAGVLLIAVVRADQTPDRAVSAKALRRQFALAGVTGALALWVEVAIEAPILLGIALGALIAEALNRKNANASPLPWLTWGITGAFATVVLFLVENTPQRLWQTDLRTLHPLYGLAWLGLALLVASACRLIAAKPNTKKSRAYTFLGLGLAAIVPFVVVAIKTKSSAFWAPDLLALRLTKLPADGGAKSFWEWLVRFGQPGKFLATIAVPLLALAVSVRMIFAKNASRMRTAVALAFGPLLLAVVYGCWKMSWWNVADALALLLLAAACAHPRSASADTRAGKSRWIVPGLALCALVPSVSLISAPLLSNSSRAELEETDLKGLIERDLAHYLQAHADEPHAIVLTPPAESVAFYYYGGLRGLGSLFAENIDGVAASVRILSASTADEAQALVEKREVNFILIPTWDDAMDQYAKVGSGQVEGTFLDLLHHWSLPNWLRPVAYSLPTVNGFENQFVSIFKVEDQQNDALALSRIADYFVDIGKPELAVPVAQSLRKYPADFGALITRASVALNTDDQQTLASIMPSINSRLSRNGGRFLAFDRRIDLAVVLARTQQSVQAKDQVEKCIGKIDAAKIRSLSVGSLYRLQVLEKVFGLRISDPELYQLARDLLTPDLRAKL